MMKIYGPLLTDTQRPFFFSATVCSKKTQRGRYSCCKQQQRRNRCEVDLTRYAALLSNISWPLEAVAHTSA